MRPQHLIAYLSIALLAPADALSGQLNWTTRSSPQQSAANWTKNESWNSALLWSRSTTTDGAAASSSWQIVTPLDQVAQDGSATQPSGSTSATDPSAPDAASPEPEKSVQQNPWILGIGGGARIGIGEPTYPLIYGRLGRIVNEDVAISLRPRYIFGNIDEQGKSNNEGAFQMPLTVNLKPTSWLSPYLGVGIATNTDSTGKTDAMVSLGADISLSRNIAIDLGLNYIFQSSSLDTNNRDLELDALIYWRF
jgi:opacity protein-like surface antigen